MQALGSMMWKLQNDTSNARGPIRKLQEASSEVVRAVLTLLEANSNVVIRIPKTSNAAVTGEIRPVPRSKP